MIMTMTLTTKKSMSIVNIKTNEKGITTDEKCIKTNETVIKNK